MHDVWEIKKFRRFTIGHTVMRRSHEIEDATYCLRVRKFHAPPGDGSAYAPRRAKNEIPVAAYVAAPILSPLSDYRSYRVSMRSRDHGERDILAFVTEALFSRWVP